MFFPLRPFWPCHTSLMIHLRSPTIHERLCRIPAQYLYTIDQDENSTTEFFTQFKIGVQFLSVEVTWGISLTVHSSLLSSHLETTQGASIKQTYIP